MLAVHFAIALLEEQVSSVQSELMAVAAMHVVGIVHDPRLSVGPGQHECTP